MDQINQRSVLVQAFIEAELQDIEELNTDDIRKPSKRFEKRIQRILRSQNHSLFRYTNTVGKRVAAIIITVGVLFGAAMSVKAIREPVVQFFVAVFEKFSKVSVSTGEQDTSVPEIITTKYKVMALPDGYTLIDHVVFFTVNQMTWANENEETIVFEQRIMSSSSGTIDTEENGYEDVMVGNDKGIYFRSHNSQTFIWTDGQYIFKLTAMDSITKDSAMEMAKSVAPEDNQ